ncbi:hypothetical protein [Brevundimonas naejangsanensis]|uniref:hypothetical protein n=1 Tax=Brevundimonas naejangsanensis TaxID=588932 RepID=UPI0026EDE698|nr:hypothetical protein [Brevundimonas naejangsanensis]
MTADLSALIARLEAAHATGIIMESEAIALQSALGLEDAHDTDWKQCCWNALRGSVDAALALAERVLGNGPCVLHRNGPSEWGFTYVDDDTAYAATPALSVCAAILRAKQGEGE